MTTSFAPLACAGVMPSKGRHELHVADQPRELARGRPVALGVLHDRRQPALLRVADVRDRIAGALHAARPAGGPRRGCRWSSAPSRASCRAAGSAWPACGSSASSAGCLAARLVLDGAGGLSGTGARVMHRGHRRRAAAVSRRRSRRCRLARAAPLPDEPASDRDDRGEQQSDGDEAGHETHSVPVSVDDVAGAADM